ncbi:MAG TPA: hypothetical protein VM824_06725, partial [Thermoleophilaceae bacterium]|nr:hypothetical protein [Thermoleophilaceae bacterium]
RELPHFSMVWFAFSLQAQVEKYGAYVGIAAFFGLAILSLLYFAQAREVKRLREWAGRAPERARGLWHRLSWLSCTLSLRTRRLRHGHTRLRRRLGLRDGRLRHRLGLPRHRLRRRHLRGSLRRAAGPFAQALHVSRLREVEN